MENLRGIFFGEAGKFEGKTFAFLKEMPIFATRHLGLSREAPWSFSENTTVFFQKHRGLFPETPRSFSGNTAVFFGKHRDSFRAGSPSWLGKTINHLSNNHLKQRIMKAKCNLAKKLEPVTKTPKWYATTASKGTLDADETAALAVVDTTLSKGEFNHAMEVASEKLIPAVLSGLTVTIGKLGKLRLSFGSQGVENIDDFDARTMIQNAKFIFTPSKEVKAALASATFEVEGVVEDGIKYGSTRSYKLAKGLITPDQPDTEDPDSGDDSGQGTFG